jgi:hypothetical protein
MMSLNVPDRFSVSGTLNQCVVVPLVVHSLIISPGLKNHHFFTFGKGVKMAGLDAPARRTASQA